jgi:NAD(P)H-hydrate repair Nnr-like enzyme with NAD(P)H-hydrate dehydratase domain
MEGSKRDDESAKKLKYVPPELITLDKVKGAEGAACISGGSASYGCTSGSSALIACNSGAGFV